MSVCAAGRRLGDEMQFGWRIAVMLLLLPAVCEAQSGDGDPDMGKKILKHAVSTGMLGVIFFTLVSFTEIQIQKKY